jgi:dolichyl-phosphate-mannose--protein O-mannosyl transferase
LSIFGLPDNDLNNDDKEYPYFAWGVISALCGSISSGFAFLYMRRIG